MFKPSPYDFNIKIDRIRSYIAKSGYSSMLICRRDNFSWLTTGGDSAIIEATEFGFCIVVVTPNKTYLVAQTMDAGWLMDQVLSGCDIEPVTLHWNEESRETKAVSIAGSKPVCDRELPGCECRFKDILKLHYPLTDKDISMYREWGDLYERTLARVVSRITPGMTELEIKKIGIAEFLKVDAYATIFLVGSDEGLSKYRHPMPSDKPVKKTVLIHPGMRRYGQHCLITRMLCFGEPDEKLRKDYNFLNMLQAHTLSMCKPGARLGDIIESRRQIVYDSGYGKEWEMHYPGGFTEYYVGTAQWGIDNEPIYDTMCLDWYLTITGAKVEELALITGNGPELLSVNGYWPTKQYAFNGETFELPDILIK